MAKTKPEINPSCKILPMIYAYSAPGVDYHEGWIKIGYTAKKTVEDRIKEQSQTFTGTRGNRTILHWRDIAMYKDDSNEFFTDKQFHQYLEKNQVERENRSEWFKVTPDASRKYFDDFSMRIVPSSEEEQEYKLRDEQDDAVAVTKEYFDRVGKKGGDAKFLWNAKPRFGKTLTTYDLIRRMKLKTVLIVTNRPSISDSWWKNFFDYISWRKELCFVSENDAIKRCRGVISREEYVRKPLDDGMGMIAFESLPSLKGSTYFGGDYPKLKWISEVKFDLLVIDEAHEGVDTMLAERAFKNISRKYTLYLSGTPFKALANEQFSNEQIFNWTYADEQEAKEKGQSEDYEIMPKLAMFTYQLSPMICDKVKQGTLLTETGEAVDYAFDLNEFFLVNESGEFIHKEEIKNFLKALTTKEKYPFSTDKLRQDLSHTLWILDRVKSAKALEKLLKENDVFKDYEIVIAAGDGKSDEEYNTKRGKPLEEVRKAIKSGKKTITLSVGQLTVGVTVPEWSGVLMLCNMRSPVAYIQAMFRAQNPWEFTVSEPNKPPQRMRKETAYVFDFDPTRTLMIYDEFAQSLSAKTDKKVWTTEERNKNNERLLNYFPVFGEDGNGEMVELNADQVLSIPRKLKSQDVVRRGFMSNFLFQNISNVFGAPSVVLGILGKLTPANEGPKRRDGRAPFSTVPGIPIKEDGEVEIPGKVVIGKANKLFGKKVYGDLKKALEPHFDDVARSGGDIAEVKQHLEKLRDTVKENIRNNVVAPVVDSYGLKGSRRERIERQVDNEIDKDFERIHGDYLQQTKIAKVELNEKSKEAKIDRDSAAAKNAREDFNRDMESALGNLIQAARKVAEKTVKEKEEELVELGERFKAEEEKKKFEEKVRAHLRGFSRSIPSFIMAYDDGDLTLNNFEKKTEAKVFEEVTGITVKDFRFLRDGGTRKNESGEEEFFEGGLFDEVVFNDSVVEFRKKREELADYFDEDQTEDIFSYIPPQKTNQIFTPKSVVKRMVDELEAKANNPGCFDDPTKTFADLYMKSGQYITEIVKRLFRSKEMKRLFPDDKKRIQHILTKQVYGMAPTRIIYLIATNYILGFDEKLKFKTKNFVQADAAKAAQNGTLPELVEKYFSQK